MFVNECPNLQPVLRAFGSVRACLHKTETVPSPRAPSNVSNGFGAPICKVLCVSGPGVGM